MAPVRNAREPSLEIERSQEYDDFIARLQTFHRERGTNFDPTPKVGTKRVDLLRLYKRVVSDGGYDAVSDTKSTRLAWRKIGMEFNLGTSNLPALAFSLKTAYYRNLAAFEIVDIHKKQPPPKEILEDVSAKGGDLLHRTIDNFHRPISRDEPLAGAVEHDASEDDGHKTPREDRMELHEPGSGGARASRGLRQAPPQRVLYQSDLSTSRHTRGQSALASSPTPSSNLYGSSNGYVPNELSQALANYEPRQQLPLTLRPVVTPGNNPDLFKANQKALKDAKLVNLSRQGQSIKGMMLPGTGFTGPNIYARTIQSLRSGILEEQEYALHHLVKISHERGDRYRFDQVQGLAEALIEKVLEVSSLLSDTEWVISYEGTDWEADREVLDGVNGTSDLMTRIEYFSSSMQQEKLETAEFARRMNLINEAGLVIRNMVMLDENAEYIVGLPSICDSLVILLNLPQYPCLAEIQHYGLEIAEQLTKFLPIQQEDGPLLYTLLRHIDSSDKGQILTSLRAISRLGMNPPRGMRPQTMPVTIIQMLCEWLLIEDESIRAACLDNLYHFTAVVDNVELLLHKIDIELLISQLVRLLMHGARTDEREQESKPPMTSVPDQLVVEPSIPRISTEHVETLLGYDEPERSSQWLRACFEEDPNGEITQIALWQAYQLPFALFSAQRPLLPAKDFITNVSSTFSSASAQVINSPTAAPRFVIRGIIPRHVPVDPKGRPYLRCLWHVDGSGLECGEFALRAKQMWEHIVARHLDVGKDSEGHFGFTTAMERPQSCRWSGCSQFNRAAMSRSAFTVGMHVKTHLPDSSERAYQRSKHNSIRVPAEAGGTAPQSWLIRTTQKDERNDPAGLPLISALVLRNLAKNIAHSSIAPAPGEGNLVWKLFAPVKEQLYSVMAYNTSLKDHVTALLHAIDVGDE